MFAKALQAVEQFTFPVVVSVRNYKGETSSSCATFIVINDEGWVATAAHVLVPLKQSSIDELEMKAYSDELARIEADASMNSKQKKNRIARVTRKNTWVTNNSYLWGNAPANIQEFLVDEHADFGVGKLEPFDPSWVKAYPTFKNPAEVMLPGTSLCRLGYPFAQVGTSWDESAKVFRLNTDPSKLAQFPNDGMHTRVVQVDNGAGRVAEYVETNTPGLRGQSGGPLFDIAGHVWGLQSKTMHLNLGFDMSTKVGHIETKLPQYLHVGMATHVKELIKMFDHMKLKYQLSS